MHQRFWGILFSVMFGFLALASAALAHKTPNRVERTFYPSGQTRVEIRFKKGKPIYQRSFTKDGKILEDRRYKEGKLYYKRISYPDGRTQSLWTRKSGKMIVYDPDGRVKTIMILKDEDMVHK